MIAYWKDNCTGKSSCDINFADFLPPNYKNIPNECFDPNNRFYEQHNCVKTKKKLIETKKLGLLYIAIYFLMFLVFFYDLEYF